MPEANNSKPHRVGRIASVALGFTIVLGTYILLSTHYLNKSAMSSDEGFYAMAASSVMKGEIPYRDFGYTQMPLLPYVNGVAMEVFGYGLLSQRTINLIWGAIGLLAIILAVRCRIGRWEPGFVAAFTVAAAPHWTHLQAMGVTHGATGCFLSIAMLSIFVPQSLYRRAALVALFCTLAVGCRLSVAPVVAALCLIPALEATTWKQRLIVLAIPAGTALFMLAPFFIVAPSNAWFFVWEYHFASHFKHHQLSLLAECWRVAPAAIIVLFTGLSGTVLLVKRRLWTEFALLFGGLLGITLPLLPEGSYGNYITPALPLAAAAGIMTVWRTGFGDGNPFRHVIWILPAIALFNPFPAIESKSTIDEIRDAADFLVSSVPAGPILTPLPIVAIEAGREVIPGTEMGMFSVMHPRDLNRARALNLTTLTILTEVIKREEPSALVRLTVSTPWNFAWQVPTLKRQPKDAYFKLMNASLMHYKEVFKGKSLTVLIRKSDMLLESK